MNLEILSVHLVVCVLLLLFTRLVISRVTFACCTAHAQTSQNKVEQRPQSEPVKGVLTPAAKAARHRRGRDKKLWKTLRSWHCNDKVCPDGDRCNLKLAVTAEKVQTVSGICGIAQSVFGARAPERFKVTCDSWNILGQASVSL